MAFSTGEEQLPSSSRFPRSRLWPQVPRSPDSPIRRFARWTAGGLGIALMGWSRDGQRLGCWRRAWTGKTSGDDFFS